MNLMHKMWVTGMVTQGTGCTGVPSSEDFQGGLKPQWGKFQFIQVEGDSGDKISMDKLDNNGLKTNMFDFSLEIQYVRLVPIICHPGSPCTLSSLF